jgi:hypothetical protein
MYITHRPTVKAHYLLIKQILKGSLDQFIVNAKMCNKIHLFRVIVSRSIYTVHYLYATVSLISLIAHKGRLANNKDRTRLKSRPVSRLVGSHVRKLNCKSRA